MNDTGNVSQERQQYIDPKLKANADLKEDAQWRQQDAATLNITMNFNKTPRLVSPGPEKKARRVGAGRDIAGALL